MLSSSPRLRWILRCLTTLGGVALFLGGLLAAGNLMREVLGPQDRYALPFVEMDCPIPPGMDRDKFLGEVQYLGELPDRLSVLDPRLIDKLTKAFAKHPAVEQVDKVELTTAKKLHIELRFRK